ncbi:hypothetical protein BDC45DRAFT_515722 [Circinella umbellata]|nr:hypothetical protein BDC45DRAFT_515722 [Circinella umbellata]
MASPQSSVDMDISDGSDLDQASHSSDMEVSNNSDDEISYNTSNNNNVLNNNVSHAEPMRIQPSNHYYYKPPSSYPRVYEVTNQNTASLYTQDVPPNNMENYYTTQAPVVTEGYNYFNYQQPINVSSSTIHHHDQQAMYYNSVNQTSLPMDSTNQSNVLEAFAAVAIEDQDKKQEDQVMNDDDTDSLSSYVTAPLYTVNESEEEGLIGDEDEDDMETLGWYKHIVHKLDTEIDKTKKSKRALEEEVLRLQIKLSVEKNKINSIMKKKEDKMKIKKKNMDKGKKKMKSVDATSIVPEEQSVTKSVSSAPSEVTSFSYQSTPSSMVPTSTPITSKLSSSTLQKPVETTKTIVSKPVSSLTMSQPSLPLPSASGTVKTNKPIKAKDTSSSSSSATTPVSNPTIQKSTVSTPPLKASTSTMAPKVSTVITSSKPPSSPKSMNKSNTLTNLKKTSSNSTPPTRVNAITQRKPSSIHPAPKNGIQHHSKVRAKKKKTF